MAIPRISSYAMPNAAELPDNRVGWSVQPQRAVLLVHDMQNYFVDFFDRAQAPVPELLAHIGRLIERCRRLGVPVVYTAQPGDQDPKDRALLSDFWGPGLKSDSTLVGIVPELAPAASDTVMVKWRYSAFKRSPLEAWMRERGRDQLLICGVYAHIGCLMTAAEAFMLDIQAFLIGDALADFSRAEHEQALCYAAGRCARVESTAAVLAGLALGADAGLEGVAAARAPVLLTPEQLRRDVAEQLRMDPAELEPDDDLLLLGLDSIRLMALVERWRGQGAVLAFVDLAETPTLAAWSRRLCVPQQRTPAHA